MPGEPTGGGLPALNDPRAFTRETHQTREAVLSGRRPAVAPRSVIGASWRRMRATGMAPRGAPEIAPLDDAALIRRRRESGLEPLMPLLRSHLLPSCEAVGQIMVVADAGGRVLWRDGRSAMCHHADGLGFVGGSAWTEGNVGTNAIGTCLVTQEPVHIHAAEHFAESHTRWTCAAAPLLDPLTGRMLGVVDVSGPAHTVHAGTVSLVNLAARVAELELRTAHQERLQGLRAIAAPLLAKVGGRALVVAQDGTTAAVTGLVAPDHLALPATLTAGDVWLPGLGTVSAEPLAGGWLLRLVDGVGDGEGETATTRMSLDLAGPAPVLQLWSPSGDWTQTPSPRHTEILVALLGAPEGRSAAELADDLFADPSRTVTVRAEMSRLRRILGPVLRHQPYRVAAGVQHRIVLPRAAADLLPGSSAPVVARLRAAT